LSCISVPARFPSRVVSAPKRKSAKLTLWPLVAATFFMVSGGAYGTEEIIHGAGYGRGILILLFLPLVWSLPTVFMIGELSSALPQEGGYYAWVRRGFGNFWGFQEAWLSLAASIFDMAIYPTLFVFYLKQMAPWFGIGNHGVLAGLLVVAACAALNVAGIRVVGITSLWIFFLLSLPFVLVVIMTPLKVGAFAAPHTAAGTSFGLLGGVLVAMWNYMGWDNASTIAQEVERPQRTYPKAMIAAVILVSLTYVLPFVAVYLTGIPASSFGQDGAWATVGGLLGGRFLGFEWLRSLIVLGGMMCAFGMFNALVMSYSRLPLAMAREGMLPEIFATISRRTNAPWVAILVCASGWALCLGLGFQRLITLDIMLYGASLMLKFVTLVVLRIREPQLKREFRVPGGLPGAVLAGVFPLVLLLLALVKSGAETVLGVNGLLFGAIIIGSGFAVYAATRKLRVTVRRAPVGAIEAT
jgi:amino acid transporter